MNYPKRRGLPLTLSRRQTLGLIQSSITTLLVGCFSKTRASEQKVSSQSSSNSSHTVQAALPACIVTQQQTEGPYFVDEKLNRSDIRSDPSNGFVKAGAELHLRFRVVQVKGSTCVPLKGAVVDIWHCDAAGVYSDVQDKSFDTTGQNFLRGYQVTDDQSIAEFVTIYPGWYQGRTVHIHFKIRAADVAQPSAEFTSQLYFDDALTDLVQSQPPYVSTGKRTQRNNQDRIYQEGGQDLTLQLAKNGKSYSGIFDVGLQMA